MSIRPFRDIKRKKTRKIKVGSVEVGGDAPISVQSMTNTLTTNVYETVKQINELEEAGVDIVRVSCPDEESTSALKKIIHSVNIPIVVVFPAPFGPSKPKKEPSFILRLIPFNAFSPVSYVFLRDDISIAFI